MVLRGRVESVLLIFTNSGFFFHCWKKLKNERKAGVPGWLSRLSIRLLILVQVMISWFVGSCPTLGSALTVWSLLGILCLPLSLPLLCSLKINKLKKKIRERPSDINIKVTTARITVANILLSASVVSGGGASHTCTL